MYHNFVARQRIGERVPILILFLFNDCSAHMSANCNCQSEIGELY